MRRGYGSRDVTSTCVSTHRYVVVFISERRKQSQIKLEVVNISVKYQRYHTNCRCPPDVHGEVQRYVTHAVILFFLLFTSPCLNKLTPSDELRLFAGDGVLTSPPFATTGLIVVIALCHSNREIPLSWLTCVSAHKNDRLA